MNFTDWLGQEVKVGDKVIYGASGGRSINMVIAEVLDIHEAEDPYTEKKRLRIKVRPLRASRWKQHWGRTRWVDTRTGKGIDPYATGEHVEVPAHFKHQLTGDVISLEERDRITREWRQGQRWDEGFKYVSATWKDYVQRVDEKTKSVTLTVTENVTRWTGDLPDEVVS